MEMCYDGALVMPSSYVVMSEDEMTYVDGGIAIPNWAVAGVIDTVISTLVGGSIALAASYFKKQAAKYGQKTAGLIFSKALKKKLIAKKFASKTVAGICSLASAGFTILMWAADPGGQLASYIDARDSNPNNSWCWG